MTSTPQASAPATRLSISTASWFGLLVLVGVVLMTLSAKAQVPFWPVPMTLQTLAVMAFAVGFGPRLATSIFAAYLAAGAAGLPVFAGTPERGIGITYMVGPTGGYLLGFLLASWLVGVLAAGRGIFGQLGAMIAGLVLTYGLGMAWLATFVPVGKVFALGVAPFFLGDLVKIGLVAVGSSALAGLLARLRDLRS